MARMAGANRWLAFVLAAILLLRSAPIGQAQEADDPAQRLLERMPPAARVGQLFIVTFPGTDIGESSIIYRLIVEDRVGGVLLRSENGNLGTENSPLQVGSLANGLQQLAWDAAQISLPDEGGRPATGPFIPLFVVMRGSDQFHPYTTPISGTTPLPSPMTIGATWNPDRAEAVGAILGTELSAMGVNFLIGPPLDVLDNPRPQSPADLGVRSFGGDPYWVGQMGTAFIRGVHEGSGGRVAVVPEHFPGLGAADRPLSEEVSTVQKSLEQLKQLELAPFFAVTGSEEEAERADGLLVSHIRYRGFQGNIYQSTRPISFDPQALQQLMGLPEIAPWRESGGLMVADELGVRAVRRFYDPTDQEFNGLRIARDALGAGNDLLIVSHFANTDDWETQLLNIRSTIAFFQEKYASDPTFQQRVDEAVLNILRLKLRLYDSSGIFTLNSTQTDPDLVARDVGTHWGEVAPIAQEGNTLLSPPSPELRLAPPTSPDRIVIFTDARTYEPCAGCSHAHLIPATFLEETLVSLYGPLATRQVSADRITSFTFDQLVDYLDNPVALVEGTPSPHPVEVALERADWVLFAMLDVSDEAPASAGVRRLLAERDDLLQGRKVVVFAFAAPYYLDTTEISKLSAYFALYNPTRFAVQAAARALFDEFPFAGASPVSVPGVNYYLITQTQPDPDQVIEISYEIVGRDEAEGEGTATPQPTEVHRGDTLQLRTSRVVDYNGHQVPDGTPVEFIFTYPQEGLEHSVQVTTEDGIAETMVTLDRTGQLLVSVRTETVPRAVRLEMDIREGEPAVIVPITPTPSPTPLPSPTPIPSPTVEATPAPTQEPEEPPSSSGGRVGSVDLVLGLFGGGAVALIAYVGVWLWRRDPVWALRGGLWCLVGGLAAYIALAVGGAEMVWLREWAGVWAAGIAAVVGAMAAFFVVLTVLWGSRSIR